MRLDSKRSGREATVVVKGKKELLSKGAICPHCGYRFSLEISPLEEARAAKAIFERVL